MKRTYHFNNPQDMIDLAIEVQSNVYWGRRFHIDDEADSRHYREFWDLVNSYINTEDTYSVSVVIEDGYVTFNTESK